MPVLISILPSSIDTPPLLPLPSITTLPVPFGNKLILALEVETMSLPFTSKSPPS